MVIQRLEFRADYRISKQEVNLNHLLLILCEKIGIPKFQIALKIDKTGYKPEDSFEKNSVSTL